ncbi:hypothetical protein H6P81_005108 [Aristolochia fimbriata]|uniref:Uncharacterized protein n=1 Tax=Aristolochia fimbriata TaxID=158543 RepID=A0AAV7EU80_ARIFI|nr:hypothetical protein H6P81_005108 [Aristolochia fimbriata]
MGGGMLRSVGRAVGAGVGGAAHEAFSSAKPKPSGLVSVSSSSSCSSSSSSSSPALTTLPVSAASGWRSSSFDSDDWVIYQDEEPRVDGDGDFFERFVFGRPPSAVEVEDAVSAIQQVVVLPFAHEQRIEEGRWSSRNRDLYSSPRPEPDGIELTLQIRNPTRTQLDGYGNAMDAFRLLRVNPFVQRMVASLSSDKAVWDAVMKNEAVREMKESLCGVCRSGNEIPGDSDENPALRVLIYVLEVAKAKVVEFIETVRKQVNDLFAAAAASGEDDATLLEETLKSSFMLSVMVLLVVLVTRSERKN